MKINSISYLAAAMFLAQPLAMAQKPFPSGKEAADALLQATESNDAAGLVEILGADAKDIVDTGDPVNDKRRREEFARGAKDGWKLVADPVRKDAYVIEVGASAWPFPIPVVKRQEQWVFDAKEGKQEIRARIIGGNELDSIELCRQYVKAQMEYASADRDGNGILEYAQRIVSSPDKKDGLYWTVTADEPPSPAAEVFAKAAAEGYTTGPRQPKIYHGYQFRILRAQGSNAEGGALNYVVKGSMIGGFALVAFPTDYGSTGVKTFVVNTAGVVYEKDLGPNTTAIAKAMRAYDPDKTWREAP